MDPNGNDLELGIQLIEFVELHLTSVLISIGALVGGILLQAVGSRIVQPKERR